MRHSGGDSVARSRASPEPRIAKKIRRFSKLLGDLRDETAGGQRRLRAGERSSACSSRTSASATRSTRRRVAGFAVRRIMLMRSSFGRGREGSERSSATSTPSAPASRTSVSSDGFEFADERPRRTRSSRATVSTVTPARAASSAWVSPASRRSCLTCSARRFAMSDNVWFRCPPPKEKVWVTYDLS